ncbi:MAG TPA: glucoamylase family protein [Bacteroidota bacterium]|nr:glucoamylase family protein [Bacteroidota bacterium]
MRELLFSALCVFGIASGQSQQKAPRWDPFLDTLEQRTVAWFLEATPKSSGLTPDRWPTSSPSSIAAVGFALSVYPIASERHLLSRAEAAQRTLATLRFLCAVPQGDAPQRTGGYRGFFYHFIALADGTRAWNCELSTIDTALLMAGILCAQSYFVGTSEAENSIRELADSLYRRVDWTWSAQGRPGITYGWTPEKGANADCWRGYSEAMIMYILALGSPTHPVEPSVWDYWTSGYVWAKYYDWEFVSFGPLFGHQYSHCWIDFRGIRDAYMQKKGIDYFENSRRATFSQQRYGAENPEKFRKYSGSVWGVTACDGPGDTSFSVDGVTRRFIGYGGRGVSFDWSLDDGTLAATGAGGSLPFAPEICTEALKGIRLSDGRVWTRFGFLDAFNPTYVTPATGPDGWVDRDYLGIDQGPIVIMAENLRSGLVWKIMKRNPYIVRGLKRAGFTGGWLEGR